MGRRLQRDDLVAGPGHVVARAKELLAVSEGASYTDAAGSAGRRSGDAVSELVARFNREGADAIEARHGGGAPRRYNQPEQERILREVRRKPDRETDGTGTWSLTTLQRALRRAPGGLPTVSTWTIVGVLRDAGYKWQRDQSWCETGEAERKRKRGVVRVKDPDTIPKKLIEAAYGQDALPVWNEDEAGPYRTAPYPGHHWSAAGKPIRYPHEYVRNGTAKQLTLFYPKTGRVRVKGVLRTTNADIHPWLKAEIEDILADLPEPAQTDREEYRRIWDRWQEGLSTPIPFSETLTPLRVLLILDNLQGHCSRELVRWLVEQGVLPLYTPIAGSWLNMAESIQSILKPRALNGEYPQSTQEIIDLIEATARGWNEAPTPFEWSGRRKARRDRARQRHDRLAGSGACTRRPLPRRRAA